MCDNTTENYDAQGEPLWATDDTQAARKQISSEAYASQSKPITADYATEESSNNAASDNKENIDPSLTKPHTPDLSSNDGDKQFVDGTQPNACEPDHADNTNDNNCLITKIEFKRKEFSYNRRNSKGERKATSSSSKQESPSGTAQTSPVVTESSKVVQIPVYETKPSNSSTSKNRVHKMNGKKRRNVAHLYNQKPMQYVDTNPYATQYADYSSSVYNQNRIMMPTMPGYEYGYRSQYPKFYALPPNPPSMIPTQQIMPQYNQNQQPNSSIMTPPQEEYFKPQVNPFMPRVVYKPENTDDPFENEKDFESYLDNKDICVVLEDLKNTMAGFDQRLLEIKDVLNNQFHLEKEKNKDAKGGPLPIGKDYVLARAIETVKLQSGATLASTLPPKSKK